jgi:two-component system, cell cycle sensor histidine kinase and response regulator CckA
VVMPGMSGCDLAAQLAAHRPELRVLYVSGYPDHPALREGVLDPGAELLRKPFSGSALAAKVRQVLDAPLPPDGGS